MPIHNYGIYHQGARFTDDDFNTIKLILHYLKTLNLSISEKAFKNLQERKFDIDTARELCVAFDNEMPQDQDTVDYNFIRTDLLEEIDEFFYVNDNEPSPFNTDHVTGIRDTEIEGEFFIEGSEEGEELDEYVMMLAFNVPHVWNRKDDTGPKTRQEAVEMLQEAAKTLLRDDIDWDKRLGVMIASGWYD